VFMRTCVSIVLWDGTDLPLAGSMHLISLVVGCRRLRSANILSSSISNILHHKHLYILRDVKKSKNVFASMYCEQIFTVYLVSRRKHRICSSSSQHRAKGEECAFVCVYGQNVGLVSSVC